MNNEHQYPNERSVSKNTVHTPRRRHTGKGRYLSDKRTSTRHRRRKLNPRFVVFIAVLFVFLACIAMGIHSCTKPTLKGRWDLDGTTVYEFSKGGKGALILMTKEYEFTYKVKENKLSIDFVDEMALDAQYTFEISGRMLFLTGGPGDTKGEYILQKIS